MRLRESSESLRDEVHEVGQQETALEVAHRHVAHLIADACDDAVALALQVCTVLGLVDVSTEGGLRGRAEDELVPAADPALSQTRRRP